MEANGQIKNQPTKQANKQKNNPTKETTTKRNCQPSK